MAEERIKRKLAAILSADVVGYSRLMASDEESTLAALKRHRQMVFEPAVVAHQGRIVKLIGDGTIVEFASVVDAVNCALSLQRSSESLQDESLRQPKIVLRIGINLGDVIIEGDDIYGDGVNIAARLEPVAQPGGICISSIVNESIGNRIDARFEDGGQINVKNIDRPIRVWRWHPDMAHTTATNGPQPHTANLEPHAAIAILPFTNMSGDPEQEYFLRRNQRRHHHRLIEDRGPDGDRAQLKLHLQEALGRCSRHWPRAWRAVGTRRLDPPRR